MMCASVKYPLMDRITTIIRGYFKEAHVITRRMEAALALLAPDAATQGQGAPGSKKIKERARKALAAQAHRSQMELSQLEISSQEADALQQHRATIFRNAKGYFPDLPGPDFFPAASKFADRMTPTP